MYVCRYVCLYVDKKKHVLLLLFLGANICLHSRPSRDRKVESGYGWQQANQCRPGSSKSGQRRPSCVVIGPNERAVSEE